MNHRQHFGFKSEPFAKDIATKDLLKLASMIGVKERLDYCLNLGGVLAVFGEVGSGKTTALRWSLSHYHASDLKTVSIVATTGSITELYKQLSWGLDLVPKSISRTTLLGECRAVIKELACSRKQRIVVCIDEAQLLRREVLAELHTIMNFDYDGANYLTMILCGQPTLVENMQYRAAAPLASRVMGKAQVRALTMGEMEEYLNHHLRVAGVKTQLFEPTALNAIYQGSAGGLRRANQLAAGGLVAAATENSRSVTADHIRTAASELM
jgi:type II secretory pathway predicted ATPase ExeA